MLLDLSVSETLLFVSQPPDPELLEAAVALPIQRWGYPSPRYPDPASPSPRVEHSGALATIASGSNKTGATTTTAEMETATAVAATGHRITTFKDARNRTDDDNENESNEARIISDGAANNNNNNNSGLLLYVRPGPKGAENAVTFLVQSPIHFFSVRARLDCAGSVNASPMPGSVGLSREVRFRCGW